MNQYQNAGVGLLKMYKAMIGMLISLVAALVFSCIPIVSLVCIIAIIVFTIQDWIGFYYVGKDIPLCKVGFFLQVISLVASVVAMFIPQLSGISSATGILPLIAQLLLIVGVTKVLKEKGATATAKWGKLTFWFIIATQVCMLFYPLSTIVLVFADAPLKVVTSIGTIFSLVLMACSIAFLVFNLKFLKYGAEEFGSYV